MTVFKRNVHLGTKDPLIETDDIANKAVTSEKIDNGAITAEKIAKGGVEWENVSEDVQNIIVSMEKGGVALSGEFGDSELIGINQKKLTEVIGPEGTLQGNINTEAQRAEDAEEALSDRVSNLETTVGEGGSIDERITTAKLELIDGASEEGDTFKKIEDRLSDVEESVGEGGSVDERIAVETNRAQATEELLREAYESLSQSQPIPKTAEEWAAMTSWEEGVIYRVAGTTSYTDYMYNGTTTILMATYNNAIDNEPTAGSDNLVKSGGVFTVSQVCHFVGEGTAFVNTKCLTVIKGHSYLVYPVLKSWNFGNLSNSQNVLTISYLNSDASSVNLYAVQYQGRGSIKDKIVVIPDDAQDNSNLYIGGRAVNGEKVFFYIEDITYAKDIGSRLKYIEDNIEEIIYTSVNEKNYSINKRMYKGDELDGKGWCITEPINCSANDVITWNFGRRNSATYISFFDSEDTYLTGFIANNDVGTREVTAPANTAYFKASFYSTYNDEVNSNPVTNKTTGEKWFIHGSIWYKIEEIENNTEKEFADIRNDIYGIGNYIENKGISYRTGRIGNVDDWNLIDYYIPIKEGDVIRYTIGASTSSSYGLVIYDKSKNYLVGYTANNKVSGTDYREITCPVNSAFVRLCFYKTLSNSDINSTPIAINGTTVDISERIYNGMFNDIEDLKQITSDIPVVDINYGVIGQNYPKEIPFLKKNLNSAFWSPRFSFLHISDNHNNGFGSAEDLLDKCNARFLVNTGDLVDDKFTDGATNTLALAQTPEKPVYLVLGNHDYHKATTKQQVFEYFIQAMNEHNNQSLTKSYFALDFTDLYQNSAVKCIFLDQNDGVDDAVLSTRTPTQLSQNSIMSDAQIRWFVSELQDAASTGKHVCVFIHNRVDNIDYDRSIRTFMDMRYDTNHGSIYTEAFLADIVDAFINATDVSFSHNGINYNFNFTTSGTFVSWFCGHAHNDNCGWLKNHPKQFCVIVCKPFKETTYYGGTYDEGSFGSHFNYVTIDPFINSLSVYRVGEQTTKYGTRRESFQVFYK